MPINDENVKLGLEIAVRILEMRLQNIQDTPLPSGLFVRHNRAHEMCKNRAVNEMTQAVEHVRNFITMDDLRHDAIAHTTSNDMK